VSAGVAPSAPARTTLELACGFGVAGSWGARLLGGPPRSAGAEPLEDHRRRLGPLELAQASPASLRRAVLESGLSGRGGGQFPLAAKLEAVVASSGEPLVIVNASEGEPASRKDRTLMSLRPHLVLDGARVAAHAVGASEVVIYTHRAHKVAVGALEAALKERLNEPVAFRVLDAPMRYVAGESSAVVSYLEGRGALPRHRPLPAAVSGVRGRPTLVSNVETIAHLALLARLGPAWFRQAGSGTEPGSTLVTLAGQVSVPGLVVEVLEPIPIGRVLATVGGLDHPPRAVLIGGYEGTWVPGELAWRAPLERGLLARAGMPLGCGLLAVLGEGSCGLATTARLLAWLAGESAGQCGPCALGLPELAQRFASLAESRPSARDKQAVYRLARSLHGRGACGHPTGAARLAESALNTFADEPRRHRSSCEPAIVGFPLPTGTGAKEKEKERRPGERPPRP
jgi:NADH:ubiquinone oxidoreductase subunit F (NADH-binding)